MYIVTQNVDYLTWTKDKANWFFAEKVFGETKSPNPNYTHAEISETGIIHLWHIKNQDMKHHYIASAQVLANLRLQGYNEKEIVKWCLENAHITRIDICVTSQREDGMPHGFNPHALAWAVRDGRLKSRMKPSKDIADNMKTQTKYIGNRKNRRRLFRAYDKGLDLGQELNKLIRYELETRQGTKTIAREVVKNTPYNAIIKRYVDFPDVAVWQEIMSAIPAQISQFETLETPLELMKEKSKSRWSWLMKSIVPVVGKALDHDEKLGISKSDNENFVDFVRAVMDRLE